MLGTTRPKTALKGTHRVPITIDDREVQAIEGESLVSAMFGAGLRDFQRNPKSGSLRGPFCLMGVCQDCRVLVDGRVVLSCLVNVRAGLTVQRLTEIDGKTAA